MSPYLAEFIGTAMLIFLGNGVVANVVLNKTKGNGSGLIVISSGWAFAVVVPALIFGDISGAHFNPAVTIALAISGDLSWSSVMGYIVAQFVGTMLGACAMYFHYKDHFDITEDKDSKLSVFSTSPAIRNIPNNFISEVLATFILIFAILGIRNAELGTMETFGVGGLILVIGVGLGGTTGYAINPSRDLGPRIVHALLPIKDKRDSDWGYAWVPVVGPLVGAVAGAVLAGILF